MPLRLSITDRPTRSWPRTRGRRTCFRGTSRGPTRGGGGRPDTGRAAGRPGARGPAAGGQPGVRRHPARVPCVRAGGPDLARNLADRDHDRAPGLPRRAAAHPSSRPERLAARGAGPSKPVDRPSRGAKPDRDRRARVRRDPAEQVCPAGLSVPRRRVVRATSIRARDRVQLSSTPEPSRRRRKRPSVRTIPCLGSPVRSHWPSISSPSAFSSPR